MTMKNLLALFLFLPFLTFAQPKPPALTPQQLAAVKECIGDVPSDSLTVVVNADGSQTITHTAVDQTVDVIVIAAPPPPSTWNAPVTNAVTGEVTQTHVSGDGTPYSFSYCPTCPLPPIEIPDSAFADPDNPTEAEWNAWVLANHPDAPIGQKFYIIGDGTAKDPDWAFESCGDGSAINDESPAAGGEGDFSLDVIGGVTNLVHTDSAGNTQPVPLCDIGPSISSPDVAGNSSGRTDFFSIDGEGVNHPVADTIVDHPAQDVLAKITGDCVKTIKIAVRDHHQDTVYVDGKFGVDATGLRERHDRPFLTIQAAVNAAEDGDEIEVHAGDYSENVSVVGRNLDFEMAGVNWSGTWTIFDQSDVTITGRPNLRFAYNAFRVQSSRASIEADRFIGTGPLGYTFFRNSEVYLDFNYHVGYLQMSDGPTVAAYDGLASRNAERGAPAWSGTYHISGRKSYHGPAGLADDRGSNFRVTANSGGHTGADGQNLFTVAYFDIDEIVNEETATGTPSDGSCIGAENGATVYISTRRCFSRNRTCIDLQNGTGAGVSDGSAYAYILEGRYESSGAGHTIGSWYSTGLIHYARVSSGVILINSGTGSNVGNMGGGAATDLRLYEEVSMDSGISAPTVLTHGAADISPNVR